MKMAAQVNRLWVSLLQWGSTIWCCCCERPCLQTGWHGWRNFDGTILPVLQEQRIWCHVCQLDFHANIPSVSHAYSLVGYFLLISQAWLWAVADVSCRRVVQLQMTLASMRCPLLVCLHWRLSLLPTAILQSEEKPPGARRRESSRRKSGTTLWWWEYSCHYQLAWKCMMCCLEELSHELSQTICSATISCVGTVLLIAVVTRG